MFGRILREPLVQFLLIGVVIFAAGTVLDNGETPMSRDRIVVTEGRVQQLAQMFAKTWQRPPSKDELRGLVDAFIKEEIHYREAVRLGLDRDDTVIRRRMQQKLQFLAEPSDAALTPTDGELEAFLAKNRERYFVEPRIAFQQVFVKSTEIEESADARAQRLLRKVRAAPPDTSVRHLGDTTMLPHTMPASPLSTVARTFGKDFATALSRQPQGRWDGPLRSAYGLHLVYVSARQDGYYPPLEEVRNVVLAEWKAQKRSAFMAAEYQRLREKYDIVLPAPFGEETTVKGRAQ